MSLTWQQYAEHLRNVCEQIGVTHPRCLPGEPDDCGHGYPDHCMSYLASLQAKAEDGLEHMHHGQTAGELQAERLLNHWRDQFNAETQHCQQDDAHTPRKDQA